MYAVYSRTKPAEIGIVCSSKVFRAGAVRVVPPRHDPHLPAVGSAMLTVELDTPSRAPTSRIVIPDAYSFTALACNTSGDQAERGQPGHHIDTDPGAEQFGGPGMSQHVQGELNPGAGPQSADQLMHGLVPQRPPVRLREQVQKFGEPFDGTSSGADRVERAAGCQALPGPRFHGLPQPGWVDPGEA